MYQSNFLMPASNQAIQSIFFKQRVALDPSTPVATALELLPTQPYLTSATGASLLAQENKVALIRTGGRLLDFTRSSNFSSLDGALSDMKGVLGAINRTWVENRLNLKADPACIAAFNQLKEHHLLVMVPDIDAEKQTIRIIKANKLSSMPYKTSFIQLDLTPETIYHMGQDLHKVMKLIGKEPYRTSFENILNEQYNTKTSTKTKAGIDRVPQQCFDHLVAQYEASPLFVEPVLQD